MPDELEAVNAVLSFQTSGMKYAFEAMRLITCVKALFTEKMAHRVIHGQFVNLRGTGPGNNLANDLRMEMKVKDDKGMLRRMCGNNTLKAVNRSTSSTYGFKLASDAIDKESGVHPDLTRHTHQCTQQLVEEMINILHERKPFQYKEARTLKSFPDISRSPLDQLDVIALHAWLSKHKRRLAANAFEGCDDDDDEAVNDDDNDEVDNNDIHDFFFLIFYWFISTHTTSLKKKKKRIHAHTKKKKKKKKKK